MTSPLLILPAIPIAQNLISDKLYAIWNELYNVIHFSKTSEKSPGQRMPPSWESRSPGRRRARASPDPAKKRGGTGLYSIWSGLLAGLLFAFFQLPAQLPLEKRYQIPHRPSLMINDFSIDFDIVIKVVDGSDL